ncbi:hydrolase/acyltransferase [Brevibacillus daliensis]|uniref:hydrolase/acyltransferase n=1 Tax=Brevibacillus daliensis TaxID=2892995 RepID=UPI001E4710EE|nr:hydrolase/acyltransferase [Brevibacillus daliensis]
MRYLLLNQNEQLFFVELPASHMYQLVALMKRLYKEIDKLTATNSPVLPTILAECSELEIYSDEVALQDGLTYINELENSFSQVEEKEYPLISLLTEIRALQAQLESLEE